MTDGADGDGFDAWYLRRPRRSPGRSSDGRASGRWSHRRRGSTWVYTVALNQVRTTLRRRGLERRFVSRHRERPEVPPAPEPDVALWRAVAQLPLRERMVVVFRYVGDLPEADIARALGITRGTVSSTLSHARQRLARLLSATHGGPAR